MGAHTGAPDVGDLWQVWQPVIAFETMPRPLSRDQLPRSGITLHLASQSSRSRLVFSTFWQLNAGIGGLALRRQNHHRARVERSLGELSFSVLDTSVIGRHT